MLLRVGGLDCAMANMGVALATVEIATGKIRPTLIKLVHTEKSKLKQVRRNSDDLSRAQLLASELRAVEPVIDFWMAEIPTGAQSARAAFGFGMAVGVLGSLTKPIIQVQSSEVKIAVTGRKTASKDEMMAWAMALYPDLDWALRKWKGQMVPIDSNEHMADALAIIHAGVLTNEFKQATALYRVLQPA